MWGDYPGSSHTHAQILLSTSGCRALAYKREVGRGQVRLQWLASAASVPWTSVASE